MRDSEHVELDRLLKCKPDELIASVRPMSANNCERYVRAILGHIGGPSFEQFLVRIVETMVSRDGRGPPTNSDVYYFAIRDLFPHVPKESDVLGRLLFVAMRMCRLRIEKNPNRALNKSFSSYPQQQNRLHAFQESLAGIIHRKHPNVAQAFDAT